MSDLFEKRLNRIKDAIAFKEVEKVPVAPCANAYFARQKNVLIKDYITDFDLASDVNIACLKEMGADVTQNVIFSPYLLPNQWLSKVAVPGKELGGDELWQVLEGETMKAPDYDEILNDGFGAFHEKFVRERLDDNNQKLAPFFAYLPTAYKKFFDADIPCICDFLMITPFEFFCGGRSLEKFFLEDLLDNPDKTEKAFQAAMDHLLPMYRNMMKDTNPTGVWIGGWRTASELLSAKIWDRFVLPYFHQYAALCVEMNVIPIFHLDSNWTRDLEKFLEFPAKKCIMALDSSTDIQRARKVLGEHMCIMGDVPANMLAFSPKEDVYDYTMGLIRRIGPKGYMVSSGCDVPFNAKLDNVQMMAKAIDDFCRQR